MSDLPDLVTALADAAFAREAILADITRISRVEIRLAVVDFDANGNELPPEISAMEPSDEAMMKAATVAKLNAMLATADAACIAAANACIAEVNA